MPAQPDPQKPFDTSALREWAGDKTFARGEEYFREGRVRGLKVESTSAAARVVGERPYKAKLWSQPGGSVEYSCECVTGRDGKFCKHCVALGLAWLAGDEHAGQADPLRAHLRALPREQLLDLVLEAADYDSILRRRLLLESEGNAPNLETWRKLIREAIATKDYIDFDALPDYVQGVDEVMRPLADAIASGPRGAALAIELCEFALVEMDKHVELVDFGDPAAADLWQQVQVWHLQACRVAKPDPAALARRLLALELESELGSFRDALSHYGEVLGERGLRAYAAALDQEWTRIPPLQPGDKPVSVSNRRAQVTALLERVTSAVGNWEAVVAVKSRDLSTPHDFATIAEGYLRRGRTHEAVAWAERGWAAFRDRPGAADDLRELLAELYHVLGRSREAMAIAWERFMARPSAATFVQLKRHAERAADAVPEIVERALAHLRTQPAGGGTDGTLLVELLLAERRPEEAWNEAQSRGCAPHVWLRLAEQREDRDPVEALSIYRTATEACVAAGSGSSYREAAEHLKKVRRLMEQLGRREAFEAYRAELRARNQHRRVFLRLLDSLG